MDRKSCFFIGHREADERLLPELIDAIERLITEEQVFCFYVGGYGGFDPIAATAVKQMKRHHPEVTLTGSTISSRRTSRGSSLWF